MEKKNIFLNISPLDHRYYLANRELFDKLALYLSEESTIKYCVKTEIALLSCLVMEMDNIKNKSELLRNIEYISKKITPEEVYIEEQKTQHNIRALVNVIKRKVPQEISHLVHLGATSVDILDTSFALRIRDSVRKVILPLIITLENNLIELSIKEANTPQVGRTHGQHAVPITFGFAMAEYVSRLGKSIMRIEEKSTNLRGKLSGAVGAYNATSIIVKDPEQLEKSFLSRLGLKASEHSTQLVEAEYLIGLLLEINLAFGIIANIADDFRNLQRSEIREITEMFTSAQVGSSTMPQKRNPWNSEHVKSLWKAYSPRVITFFMDQISEHQRDLTNSASLRFITEYLTGFSAAADRMNKVVASLKVHEEKMKANISGTGGLILAEAVYILISLAGEKEGHEIVRKLTLKAEKYKKPLIDILKEEKEIWEKIKTQLKQNINKEIEELFSKPEMYSGIASEKSVKLGNKYRKIMSDISDKL